MAFCHTVFSYPTRFVYYSVKDNSLFVPVPFFTTEQKKAFDAIVEKHFSPLIPEYEAITNKFITAYKKLFPKHLSDDVDRMCQSMFSNLYATVIAYARKINAIEKPSDEFYCEVLLQH